MFAHINLKKEDSLMNHSHSFSAKKKKENHPDQTPINLLALLSGP